MDEPDVTLCGYWWKGPKPGLQAWLTDDHACNELLQGDTLEHVHSCCCGAKDYSDWDKPRD